MSRVAELLTHEWPCVCPSSYLKLGRHADNCDQVVAHESLIQLWENGFAVIDLRDEATVERIAQKLYRLGGGTRRWAELGSVQVVWRDKARAVLAALAKGAA